MLYDDFFNLKIKQKIYWRGYERIIDGLWIENKTWGEELNISFKTNTKLIAFRNDLEDWHEIFEDCSFEPKIKTK